MLDANRRVPPELSNEAEFVGLFVMLGCMIARIGTLLIGFRRQAGAG